MDKRGPCKLGRRGWRWGGGVEEGGRVQAPDNASPSIVWKRRQTIRNTSGPNGTKVLSRTVEVSVTMATTAVTDCPVPAARAGREKLLHESRLGGIKGVCSIDFKTLRCCYVSGTHRGSASDI